MANGLRRRQGQHPGPDLVKVPQHQNPLYIGCSTELSTRLKAYNVNGSLANVNKPLAFLLSVLRHAGLEPELTQRIVVKVWNASCKFLANMEAISDCHDKILAVAREIEQDSDAIDAMDKCWNESLRPEAEVNLKVLQDQLNEAVEQGTWWAELHELTQLIQERMNLGGDSTTGSSDASASK
ncbi:hypothetical protein CORC01_10905 [Colletotrichum orchidophilum]|uniref:Uncharacterized protein n=1 Tax=Colletotrichum orchidophilum TaxID=1209926 RepID=A0A1G4AX89_9PEZI|nr:uncharacterized protein CORC01_10905 [Colletotrichum orchidophilum]OHE93779.1 hypothetical protein CORC01_10905 [Colletotrichum orchidophilum]